MIIPIVFSTDDNYVLPLSVAIQSLKNNKKNTVGLDIYIFYEKLEQKNIDLLKELDSQDCNINFKCVSGFFKGKGLYSVDYFSIAMYYRIAAPLILSQYEKIIYLDCDIIVRGCISEIYNVNLQNNVIGAVRDVFFSKDTYVNSGVIVFNVKNYIDEKIFDRCLDYIGKHKDLGFPDQDAINNACEDKICYLKFNYNFMSYLATDSYLIRTQNINKINQIKILHFTSSYKPWLYKNFPFANLWWKEAKKLPKTLKKELNKKYLTNINTKKFKYGFYKYLFGSKIYKFFIKVSIKLKGLFGRNKNQTKGDK